MSSHTINLRSESPPLLVEFSLPPGTHARIGASLDAEVSLPLAGLAEIACTIGRTSEGRLYVADPEGDEVRYIALPAALPLPPFQFVVFQPVDTVVPIPAIVQAKRPKKTPTKTLLSIAAIGLALIVAGALIMQRTEKNTAEPSKVENGKLDTSSDPIASSSTSASLGDGEAPESAETALVAPASIESPKVEASPTVQAFDLEELAQRVAPTVFKLVVKNGEGEMIGSGTAFAISADGLAVTNFHVVDGGESFTARTTQGAEFAVSGVAAVDPLADLALITIKGTNIPFLEIGESDPMKIGAPVIAYGSPQGLTGTLSEGILSARRNEPEIMGLAMPNDGHVLQITAPISPGSSGSPVIDHSGKVIGVAVVASVSSSAQNLNFAVPAEAVEKLRMDLQAGLAESFRSITPETQLNTPKPKDDPDSAFYGDPSYSDLLSFSNSEDWVKCAKLARRLTEQHPKSPRAQAFLGIALNGLGLYEQAESAFVTGLAMNPEDAGMWGLLGNVQQNRKKVSEARASWKRGGSIAPDMAAIWTALVNSYFLTKEFREAISPLENLRNADREEFNRVIEFYRVHSIRSPDLQALFDHFDGLDGIEGHFEGQAELPELPHVLAHRLVSQFLRNGEGPDVTAELADYAGNVDPYFDQGAMTRAGILKDLTDYRRQWPHRTLRLVSIEAAERQDVEILAATFVVQYTASDGRRHRSGSLLQGVRYKLEGGRWVVSGIQTIKRLTK